MTLDFTFLCQLGGLITSNHTFRSSWNFQKLMQVRYASDLRACQVVKMFFQDQGVHKSAKEKPCWIFFSILDVKYFFNKKTLTSTCRNPKKYSWNSTEKTKKKNFSGFILRDITPSNYKNVRYCYFWSTLGTSKLMWNSIVFMILWISERFTFYLLAKNSFNFKLGFFTYCEYISGGIIRKNNLRSGYYSARWYWCKKYQKNLPKPSYKAFSQWLIVNCSFLWAFMHHIFCKKSFSGGKNKKHGIPAIKITKLLSILAGLILHSYGV